MMNNVEVTSKGPPCLKSYDLNRRAIELLQREGLDDLLSLIMGRSGKLRAPAIRKGSVLVVGFNPDILSDTLL